ncbi:hypothetical protein RhiJN_27812 [Ceratobasidium sp. AG-Ba]|nr:hypothetical protein RhiJN_27812 [Ceratobasidium sp. AG-Ba]
MAIWPRVLASRFGTEAGNGPQKRRASWFELITALYHHNMARKPKPQSSQPVRRSARHSGAGVGPLLSLPTSNRRGRKSIQPVGHEVVALADQGESPIESDQEATDDEIDQLAGDTSLLGFAEGEGRGRIELENQYYDRLHEETLSDVFRGDSDEHNDEDAESIDEYEEIGTGTRYDIVEIDSSVSSLCAVLEESDDELVPLGIIAVKEPIPAVYKSACISSRYMSLWRVTRLMTCYQKQ